MSTRDVGRFIRRLSKAFEASDIYNRINDVHSNAQDNDLSGSEMERIETSQL